MAHQPQEHQYAYGTQYSANQISIHHQQHRDGNNNQPHRIAEPLYIDTQKYFLFELFNTGRLSLAIEPALARQENNQTQQHSGTGEPKAVLPTMDNTQVATGQRGQKCTYIDTHIEDGKT